MLQILNLNIRQLQEMFAWGAGLNWGKTVFKVGNWLNKGQTVFIDIFFVFLEHG